MKELINWLNANKISFVRLDNEVLEIEGFGKAFVDDLSSVQSIFKTQGDQSQVQFNLMENASVLMEEGIFYVFFPFGRNWYYFDLREKLCFNILKYIGKRQPSTVNVPFVNLGIHTGFELLNGSGDIATWVKKAVYLEQKALGICDLNTMAATLSLQKECEKAGLKHIIGYSFSFEHQNEIIDAKIYCQSQKGLRNLLRIQKEINVDSPTRTLSLPKLLSHAEGNILVLGKLSSFWMKQNPNILHIMETAFEKVFYQVDLNEYKADRIDVKVLKATQHFFENFYIPEADTFSIEPILICDTFYLDKDDARNKIILNKIANGAAHEQSDEQYFKDTDEHYSVIRDLFNPEHWDIDALFTRMCRHTIEIAEGATARYETERNFMPQYDMTQEELIKYGDRHTMFRKLLEEGFKQLIPIEKEMEYRQRLENEIYILESTNNIDYILVQFDTVNWARANNIQVGCGRGSAGGSLVLYLLGITLIDPIKYDLLFERFLLPERAGLYPDRVTAIAERVQSTDFIKARLSNGKIYLIDRDAKLLVKRDGGETILYADQLQLGDDIIFDNRDLLFCLNEVTYEA